MTTKAFNMSPRKPAVLSEEAARQLEESIAAKGEGVAGQEQHRVENVLSLATSPLERPAQPHATPPQEIRHHEPAVEQHAARQSTLAAEPHTSNLGGEPERSGESLLKTTVSVGVWSETRVPPATGIGTMHNPRVRKTDGVKTRATSIHLPIDLARKLAVHCAMTGRRQSDVIVEVLEAALGA